MVQVPMESGQERIRLSMIKLSITLGIGAFRWVTSAGDF